MSSTKRILVDALARMREAAGDQTPEPRPGPALETDPGAINAEYERLVVDSPGQISASTGRMRLSKIEKHSLVKMARRGSYSLDETSRHAAIASCELLVAYGYATKVGYTYNVTPAGRAAAKQAKLSMRLG